MPKFYGPNPTQSHMDIICKHCGQRYGIHSLEKDACPLLDIQSKVRRYGEYSKTDTFEPRETFLEDLTNGKGVSDADLGDVLKKLSDL